MKRIMNSVMFVMMALTMQTLIGCDENDNPAAGGGQAVLTNFSNTGCKSSYDARTRAGRGGSQESLEISATERGGIYVKHNDVELYCGLEHLGAKAEIAGDVITVSEFDETSEPAFCFCTYDLAYEIGPLEEGRSYTLKIDNETGTIEVGFVYTSDLSMTEKPLRKE